MSMDKLMTRGSEQMFEKIKKHFTFCISTLALLNASAFSGYLMSQSELDEIVVTPQGNDLKVCKMFHFLFLL